MISNYKQTNKLKSGVTLRSPHRTLVKFFGVIVFVRAHQISPPLDQTTHKKKNTVQDETHSHINFLGNYTPSIDKAIFPVPLLESLYYDIGVIEYQIFQRS